MGYKVTRLLFSLFILFSIIWATDAQVSQVEYGKNRIQYHDDFDQWLFYESENFITYWYGKARNQGVATVKYAEQVHDQLLDVVEHRINDKIEILVYSDVSNLKQSNIGHEEAFNTEPGKTKIEGSKIFVYFNGDHDHLRRQIRRGIARIFLNNMFFGSNLQEVVQNSVAANIPEWFQDGLVDYAGNFWSYENDDELRNVFLYEKKTDFKRLSGYYPALIGHSLWYYVAITYGRSEIANLLYLARINRSVDDAFLYVFGFPFEDLVIQWEAYFKNRYETEQSLFAPVDGGEAIKFKRKKGVPTSLFRFSPDGNQLAIVDNNISKTRIMLYDLQSGRSKKIYKHGYRNNLQATDYDYPLVSWLPDGSGMFILYEFRDNITLKLIDYSTGEVSEQVLPERYQRVYAMECLNSKELIFSALSEGMVDLFYYTPNTRQSNQLTNDIYDDLDVRRAQLDGVDGLVFSSNRPDAEQQSRSVDTTLPFLNYNLFHLAYEDSGPKIYQISHEKDLDLRKPVEVNGDLIYLSAENGILNRKKMQIERTSEPRVFVEFVDGKSKIITTSELDSIVDTLVQSVSDTSIIVYQSNSSFQSNYLHNIQEYDVSAATGMVVESFLQEDDYEFYLKPLDAASRSINSSLHQRALNENQLPGEVEEDVSIPEQRPIREVIRSSGNQEEGKKYLFQSEFEDMETPENVELPEDGMNTLIVPKTNVASERPQSLDSTPINRLRIVPYTLKFKMVNMSVNMDNDPLFGGLDSYTAFKREYEPPPIGILIKSTIKDLFEDYVFEGGVRIPTTFDGAEVYLVHDNRKKRLDKRYAVYRRTLTENQNVGFGGSTRTRTKILLGQFGVRYPLDIYNSLRATATLRQDKTVFLASDRNSLDAPDLDAQRIGLKLEYVFDNSLDIDVNIRSGTRFKVYTEFVKKFEFSFNPFSFELNKGFMTVIGTDARQYFNFAKHSVLAARFAAATSFGAEKILHFLGGPDNWLIPKFDEDTPQPTEGNFAYQTISPNLRGFNYNVRNGSTYALLNAELRIPFFKYLSRRPIKIAFIRHMQAVAFADVGAAWEGLSPFDEDNPINIEELENPPTVRLRVNYYRDPVVLGYGVGIRTLLFGYFLRLDYAWGVETRIIQKPKLHFSMGLDF